MNDSINRSCHSFWTIPMSSYKLYKTKGIELGLNFETNPKNIQVEIYSVMNIFRTLHPIYLMNASNHPHEKINRCLTDINRCLTDIFKI